jgi:hypothetical protein
MYILYTKYIHKLLLLSIFRNIVPVIVHRLLLSLYLTIYSSLSLLLHVNKSPNLCMGTA